MAAPLELSHPIYTNEAAARTYLEQVRWPNGVHCPMCGSVDQARPLNGASMGDGWFYCGACQDKFTVRTRTVYERSHIPLHKWLLAFRLMASSKKGISAHQLHRTLGITYKSAWFLAHRVREAMKELTPGPLGGPGKVVEADEVYVGPSDEQFVTGKGWRKTPGGRSKSKVMTLVERGGRARSIKVESLKQEDVAQLLAQHVHPESRLHTDEAPHFKMAGKAFAAHERVNHGKKEYARGDVTTNSVEGFFSIFRRGMIGTYQHCAAHHLQRYVIEFDFRYGTRAALGIDGSVSVCRRPSVAARLGPRYLQNMANPKRPRDLNQLAKAVVDLATGTTTDRPDAISAKNPAAVSLGRLGGLKGGPARAAKLTPKKRQEIAKIAARSRWKDKPD